MRSAAPHRRQHERLTDLRSHELLDAPREPVLESLCEVAAQLTATSMAAITLGDGHRQRLAVGVGFGWGEPGTREAMALCGRVLATGAPLVAPGTTAEARLLDGPLVTGPAHLRFYAGVPLIGRDGVPMGTLCVLDTEPRDPVDHLVTQLTDLATAVVGVMELRSTPVPAATVPAAPVPEVLDVAGAELRAGLAAGQFVLHYQPVVELDTGRLAGVEALVRWDHPERGCVPPVEFLPLAEATGLIVPLGRQVLEQACADLARWHRRMPDLHVAVNVSAVQLGEPGFVTLVADILRASGLRPEHLTIEITETALLSGTVATATNLAGLHRLGTPIALDDFGTGYSSLSYLRELDPAVIKVDKSFIDRLGRSARDTTIVGALIALADRLDITVVAEGVEDCRQVHELASMGCQFVQGYHFSPPVPAPVLSTDAWLVPVDGCVLPGTVATAAVASPGRHSVEALLPHPRADGAEDSPGVVADAGTWSEIAAVVSELPVVMFAFDREGVCVLSEGQLLDRLGLTAGQVVGTSFFDLYAGEPEVVADLRRVLDGESFARQALVAGMVFQTYYRPVRDPDGSVTGGLGISLDASERVEAERSRNVGEGVVHALLAALPFSVFRLDRKGYVQAVNRGELDRKDQPISSLVGRRVGELFPQVAVPLHTVVAACLAGALPVVVAVDTGYELHVVATSEEHVLVIERHTADVDGARRAAGSVRTVA